MAEDNSKKYLDKAGLNMYTQQLKNKLDETYTTFEYVNECVEYQADSVMNSMLNYETILTIPQATLNELIDGTGEPKNITYEIDTINLQEGLYRIGFGSEYYIQEAHYDDYYNNVMLYAYFSLSDALTTYGIGYPEDEVAIRIVIQDHIDQKFNVDETKTCIFIEMIGFTEEVSDDVIIYAAQIDNNLLHDYATKEYVDDLVNNSKEDLTEEDIDIILSDIFDTIE